MLRLTKNELWFKIIYRKFCKGESNTDGYRQMKFIVRCAVLFIFINICCGILVPIVMNVINNAVVDNDVQNVIGSHGLQSFAAWLATAALMCRVLWEDGKKNTAYQIYDAFFAALCFALIFFVYFGPVVLVDGDTAANPSNELPRILLSHYYTTCDWIRGERIGYPTAAALAVIASIVLMASVYIISHAIYVKKHPEL